MRSQIRCGNQLLALVAGLGSLLARAHVAHAEAPASPSPTTAPSAPPTTKNALAVPVEEQGFDPAQYAFDDLFGVRHRLFNHGIAFEPNLIVDYSKVLMGGLNTRDGSVRERFNFPLELDTEKLFGLHGGQFAVVYQLQNGGNASHALVGDAQNFSFATDADDRSQIGQLWYQQKFLEDTIRIRAGKLEANADFDVLDNVQEFMNNSFQTSPTLGLMPSFPDTGTGVVAFYEPTNGFYAGAGVFDGSGARGVKTGEYGPKHFFDRPNDIFLISEIGLRYKFPIGTRKWPGKSAIAGWYDGNRFDRLDGTGRTSGTGGWYLLFDQLLWRPYRRRPVPAGPPGATPDLRPTEEEYPGGLAMSASVGWADPVVNRIDGSAVLGFNYTGLFPSRPIDVLGAGAACAHFSHAAGARDPYELAIETLYRVRVTQWVSFKPDLQYIIHPNGSGAFDQPVRHDALVVSLRMEMSF
jgi:porin